MEKAPGKRAGSVRMPSRGVPEGSWWDTEGPESQWGGLRREGGGHVWLVKGVGSPRMPGWMEGHLTDLAVQGHREHWWPVRKTSCGSVTRTAAPHLAMY